MRICIVKSASLLVSSPTSFLPSVCYEMRLFLFRKAILAKVLLSFVFFILLPIFSVSSFFRKAILAKVILSFVFFFYYLFSQPPLSFPPSFFPTLFLTLFFPTLFSPLHHCKNCTAECEARGKNLRTLFILS